MQNQVIRALLLWVAIGTGAPGVKPVRLLYRRLPGAEACPTEQRLRDAISSRLGQDPFVDQAPRTLEVEVGPRPDGLEARLALRREGSAAVGERTLTSASRDCGELVEALALAASIAIDPLGAGAARAPPPPPPEPAPRPAAPPPPGPVPAPPEPSPHRTWVAFAGPKGSLGAGPGPSLGASLGGRLQGERLSLGLEAAADLPSSRPAGRGQVESSTMYASLVPCLHAGYVGACALGMAGVQRSSGQGLVDTRQVATPYLALGGRVEACWPREGALAVAAHADLQVPLTRATLLVDDQEAWSTPPLAASLGLRLVGRFE